MKANLAISYRRDGIVERSFLTGVFAWMGVGLLITSAISYAVLQSPNFMLLLIDNEGITVVGYIAMFLPLAFVLLLSFGFNQFSQSVLLTLYIAYAAIMGVSLSFIFLTYTTQSINATLLMAALMFGLMSFFGFITSMDLTKMGSIFLMALMGIIISSLINLYLKSNIFSYIISFISIILFCGLTAWDVQKLKNISAHTSNAEAKSKLGILGALTLYMDFINLFLSLLRFTGRRRNN